MDAWRAVAGKRIGEASVPALQSGASRLPHNHHSVKSIGIAGDRTSLVGRSQNELPNRFDDQYEFRETREKQKERYLIRPSRSTYRAVRLRFGLDVSQ